MIHWVSELLIIIIIISLVWYGMLNLKVEGWIYDDVMLSDSDWLSHSASVREWVTLRDRDSSD